MASTRTKTTVYFDPELLRAVKVIAASTGRHDYEILEDAVRAYLRQADTSRHVLRELLSQLGASGDLSDEEALHLAYTELHAGRSRTRQRS